MTIKKIDPRVGAYLLLGLLLLIGILAEFGLRQPPFQNNWLWIVLIGVGVYSGYLIYKINNWLPRQYSQPDDQVQQNYKSPQIVLYCIAGSLVVYLWVIFRLWFDLNSWKSVLLPWLFSIGLMILSGWLIDSLNTDASIKATSLRPLTASLSLLNWVEVCGFVLILTLAVFLRIYRIDQIPPGIFVDETNGALDALNILAGNLVSPFTTGWYQTPNLYMYYMAGIIKVFGANYAALKIISLLPAILTVVAIFFLGRLLFGPIGGLSAMLFMAVNRWHLTLSRWGWAELMPPLFMTLSVYFLAKGIKSRKILDYIIGGVLCGLMVYTYVASRLAVVAIFFFCIYWLFSNRGGIRENLQTRWVEFSFFWIAAILVVSPLMITYIKDPFTFFNRIQEVNIFNDVKQQNSYQPLVSNLLSHLTFFHQSGDINGRHNLPGEPELDPFTGILFVIGLAYSLICFRDAHSGLLWIWLVLGLAGGILSTQGESPQAFRTIIVIPSIALFCTSVLDIAIRGIYVLLNETRLFGGNFIISQFKAPKAALVTSAILLLIWTVVAIWESHVYFGPQAESEMVKYSFNFAENKVANEVVDKIKNHDRVYLSAHFYYFSILDYLAAGVMEQVIGSYDKFERPYQLSRPELDVPIANDGKDATFILDVYYQSLVDYIKLFYPASKTQLVTGSTDTPLYVQVDIPQSAIQKIQGLIEEKTYADGKTITEIVSNIDDIWNQNDITTAEWTGGIRIDKPGFYEFKTEGGLMVMIDGSPWKGRQYLCNGFYEIQVYQKNSQQNKLARLSWLLPDGTEEIIPPQVLFQMPPPQIGLVGKYYDNVSWQGEPICTKLTPFFLLSWPDQDLFPSSFSASFSGYIYIAEPGKYHFVINADDGAVLKIDNQVIGQAVIPSQPNTVDVNFELSPGYHPIELDYFQTGGGNALDFYWSVPGDNGVMVPVPPSVFFPVKP